MERIENLENSRNKLKLRINNLDKWVKTKKRSKTSRKRSNKNNSANDFNNSNFRSFRQIFRNSDASTVSKTPKLSVSSHVSRMFKKNSKNSDYYHKIFHRPAHSIELQKLTSYTPSYTNISSDYISMKQSHKESMTEAENYSNKLRGKNRKVYTADYKFMGAKNSVSTMPDYIDNKPRVYDYSSQVWGSPQE